MKTRIAVITLAAVLVIVASCGDDGGSTGPNAPPTTTIQSLELLPEQQYRAHIMWSGSDPDGEVNHYEIAWKVGHVLMGSLGAEEELEWHKVTVHESTFTLDANLCSSAGTCSSSYTFFVRAVDGGGAVDTSPPYESFTTRTLLPEAEFLSPSPPRSSEPTCLRLIWRGDDADGEVVEYRYCKKLQFDPPAEQPYPDWD